MKKVFLINIIFIIIIFLLLELSIRIFTNITVHGIASEIINQSINPKFNYANISGKKVFGKKVYTDKNGFRITKNKKEKFSSVIKNNLENIYFIGGSVTFGSGVNQEDTFSGILDSEIKNTNIYNASVIGGNLSNNYNILKSKIKDENLKKIFINLSLDDIIYKDELIIDDNLMLNNNDKKFLKKLKQNIIIQKLNTFIRSKSVIWVWLKGSFLNSEKGYYEYALNSFKNNNNLEYLDKYLALVSEYNKKLNNKIIFLIIPYSYQIKNNNCTNTDFAEKIILKNLNNKKFDYIEIKKVFCNDENKDEIFFKNDPSHLSVYGHKLLANYLRKELN